MSPQKFVGVSSCCFSWFVCMFSNASVNSVFDISISKNDDNAWFIFSLSQFGNDKNVQVEFSNVIYY